MGAFKSRWLLLSSYDIWSIMRLVTTSGPNSETYLVYSPFASVGGTEHDIPIFRAFLSLLICDDSELAAISVPPLSPPGNSSSHQPSEGSEATSQKITGPTICSQVAESQNIQVSYCIFCIVVADKFLALLVFLQAMCPAEATYSQGYELGILRVQLQSSATQARRR